jgi:putative DNA primase/helicase
MNLDDIISPEVLDEFSRTPEAWAEAFNEAADDHKRLSDLIEDMHLDPLLKAVPKRGLVKLGAKLLGTTARALTADLKLGAVENEPRRDHLSLAREAVESFGEGGLIFAQGEFWSWQAFGVWGMPDEQAVRKAAISAIEGCEPVTDGVVRSVSALMKDVAHRSGTQFDKAVDRRINCQNGTLEYVAGEWHLREHRRCDYLTTQIPVVYDPAATCPRFDSFLAEIFEGDEDAEDKAQAALEMVGYSLLQSCAYEKFAILIGGGSNGKSVLLKVLGHLAGESQVAAIEPHTLADRFKRGHLRGKLLNVVPELPVGSVLADASMKSFTSGDVVNGEFKGSQPFDFRPFATFWLGTNNMPHVRDLSDGMFRRALILSFNRKFTDETKDAGLIHKLLEELPGILTAACKALGKVFERGYISTPPSSAAALKRWRVEADQVASFLEEKCVVDAGAGPISHEELFGAFNEWARAEAIRHSVTGKGFTSRLHKLLGVAEDFDNRVTIDGKRQRGFFGIDLASRLNR